MQIQKWFLERRANDEENFPELPSEEEGGSNALAKLQPQQELKGGKTQKLSASKLETGSRVVKDKQGATSTGGKGYFVPSSKRVSLPGTDFSV